MENTQNVVEDVEVAVVEKEGFGTRVKNGAKKVFSSKPAKIIGGVLLAAGGAVVGYKIGSSGTESSDDADYDDYDEDQYEEEVPDEAIND
jgi:hypothetical protein